MISILSVGYNDTLSGSLQTSCSNRQNQSVHHIKYNTIVTLGSTRVSDYEAILINIQGELWPPPSSTAQRVGGQSLLEWIPSYKHSP